MIPAQFITTLLPAAIASAKTTGIPAAFVIAEGALESGWGTSALTVKACNLFGVKADPSWHGESIAMPTKEFINGQEVEVMAHWRQYPNWQASIDDHAQFFLDNPRYANALKVRNDPEAFAHAIAAAGYATDPDYANKIIALMQEHQLVQAVSQYQ